MSARPWYKRYPADFIAGTLELTLEEKGAYSICLDLMYDRRGPIPDDPKWIARVCGCSTRRWNQIREKLISGGKLTSENGFLRNDRVEKQNLSEEKEHDLFVENGAKVQEKKREKKPEFKDYNNLAKKGLNKTAQHTRYQIPDNPDGLSPHTPQELFAFELPDWIPEKDWRDFCEMRKRKRQVLTDAAKRLTILKLDKMRQAGHDPALVLQQSTMNSWTGIFELKGDGNGKRNKPHNNQLEGFGRAAAEGT